MPKDGLQRVLDYDMIWKVIKYQMESIKIVKKDKAVRKRILNQNTIDTIGINDVSNP